MPKKPGHPPVYTDDKADEILIRMIEGESVRSITKDPSLPCFSTVLKWTQGRSGAPVDFGDRYNKAMQLRGATRDPATGAGPQELALRRLGRGWRTGCSDR